MEWSLILIRRCWCQRLFLFIMHFTSHEASLLFLKNIWRRCYKIASIMEIRARKFQWTIPPLLEDDMDKTHNGNTFLLQNEKEKGFDWCAWWSCWWSSSLFTSLWPFYGNDHFTENAPRQPDRTYTSEWCTTESGTLTIKAGNICDQSSRGISSIFRLYILLCRCRRRKNHPKGKINGD